jgi:hypothetical protein
MKKNPFKKMDAAKLNTLYLSLIFMEERINKRNKFPRELLKEENERIRELKGLVTMEVDRQVAKQKKADKK